MDCLKCGFTNPEQARFCAGCGLAFASIECQHCKTENSPGSRFCNSCGQSLADKSPEKTLRSAHSERRILTVLFCDLVDSTRLVDNLDPELSREIIRDFQRICEGVIEENGGRVSTYLGDGMVALFSRHESNAERAINTALHINREIEQARGSFSRSNQKIQVRSGIATGLAVVGDNMPGDPQMRQETAIGLPLNMAARIQGLAEPAGVAIGSTTHQMTRELFEFEDIGHHLLKGIKDSQQVWRVISEKSISARFVAHAARMTPMVDRTEILQKLHTCWDKSTNTDGKVVVFTGEPGVGKSRITQQLTDTISSESQYYDLVFQCSSNYTNTALYPVVSLLNATAGIERGESTAVQINKLQLLLSESSDDLEGHMPAFLELLSLSAEDEWPCPDLDPDEKKEWMFSALITYIFSLSYVKPLLITFEDVHWIDPTTLELLSRIVSSLKGHAILLLITSRPGFAPDFLKLPYVTALEVESLPQEYAQRLVDQVNGDNHLPAKMLDEIVRRTEGNPLFIEEFSKGLLESISPEDFNRQLDGHEKLDLPATVQESLLARIDRLPEASRDVALLAAVIGRDFSYDLLESVADYQGKNLYQDLTPLLNAQLVLQRKAPPNAEFSFKHALVRDVAYETLLKSDLVKISKRIGEVIERNYPDMTKKSPELVAKYFTEGREYIKAISYWLRAGEKASRRSSNVEAEKHFKIGLSLLPLIEDTDLANRYELKILLALGPIYMSTYGTGAERTHEVYMRAHEISANSDDANLKFIALWNRWRISVNDGFPTAVKWADELLDLAGETRDTGLLLQAHHCQWGTLYNLGEQRACCAHVDVGLRHYDEEQHRYDALIYGGHDPCVCAYGQSALSLWLMGKFQLAEERLQQGLAWSEVIDHLGTRLHLLDITLMYHRFRNEPGKVLEQVEFLKSLVDIESFQDYGSKVKIYSGWARGVQEGTEASLDLLNQGMAEQEATGTWEDKPVFLEMSAQVNHKLGRYEQVCQDIERALESAGLSGVSYWNAELYRRKAAALLEIGGENSLALARENYGHAIDIAMEQQELTLALRAATELANVNVHVDEKERDRSCLQSLIEKFPSGSNSIDLDRARAVMQFLN